MPLFGLRIFSEKAATAERCCALVLYLAAFVCNTTSDWLTHMG